MRHFLPNFAAGVLLAALTLIAAPPVAAEATRFGARSLDVPAPREFAAIGQAVPKLIELSEAYLPPGNRLVEIYVAPEDRAALLEGRNATMARYFQLQVLRRFEGTPLSAKDFADASQQIEAEMAAVAPNLEKQTEGMIDAGNKALSDHTGTDTKVQMGQVHYHGVFRREPWAMFFTLSSQVAISGQGGSSGRMISAGAVALVNHQLLFLYAYSDGDDGSSRRWAEGALGAWADALYAANPDDPAVAAKAEPFQRSIDWGSVGRKGLIGAILGGAIGLFYFLLKRGR